MLSEESILKEGLESEDMGLLHANLYMLLGFYTAFCKIENLPCKVTSLISDHVEGRVSITHRDKRAFDASVKGWPEETIEFYVEQVNELYKDIAAISYSDKKPRAVIYHDVGLGSHLHHQVKP